MAKFVLTIESDDPLEIASFLSPQSIRLDGKRTVETPEAPIQQAHTVEAVVEMQAEKPARGRKAKVETASSAAEPEPSDTSEPATETGEASDATAAPTLNDVNEILREVVKAKSAQIAVTALKEKFGTPSPAQIEASRYAEVIAVLKGL